MSDEMSILVRTYEYGNVTFNILGYVYDICDINCSLLLLAVV